eukprot:5678121-Amphidinium_carterae.2
MQRILSTGLTIAVKLRSCYGLANIKVIVGKLHTEQWKRRWTLSVALGLDVRRWCNGLSSVVWNAVLICDLNGLLSGWVPKLGGRMCGGSATTQAWDENSVLDLLRGTLHAERRATVHVPHCIRLVCDEGYATHSVQGHKPVTASSTHQIPYCLVS